MLSVAIQYDPLLISRDPMLVHCQITVEGSEFTKLPNRLDDAQSS